MVNAVKVTGNVGARVDVAIRQNSAMTPHEIVLWQDDEQTLPLDLSGYVLSAAVRTREDTPSTRPMTATVTAPGTVLIEMPPEQTSLLPAPTTVTGRPVVCDWAFSITPPDGDRVTVLYGEFEVWGAVPE